jgi:MerR family transcriptional regulator, heat shock protein HspR
VAERKRREARPFFMISIAAELAEMHPQTLRMYERRGLLHPRRTAKNTRLYSLADVERLRRIQELTDLGLNLAGVERVLELEVRLAAASRQVERLSEEVAAATARLHSEVRKATQAHRRDLVPVRHTAIVRIDRTKR